jgi:hypothetical protein
MSSWNFDISLLIWQEQIQKLFFFFLWLLLIFGEEYLYSIISLICT